MTIGSPLVPQGSASLREPGSEFIFYQVPGSLCGSWSRDYALKAPFLAHAKETQASVLSAHDLVHLPGPLIFWATSKGTKAEQV